MKSISSPFPVYERLALAGQLSLATRPAFVDASDALREHVKGDELEGYGPVMPPFESLWIEGQDFNKHLVPYRIALHVQMNTRVFSIEKRREFIGHQVNSFAIIGGKAVESMFQATFTVADDGGYGAIEPTVALGRESWLKTRSKDFLELRVPQSERMARLALFVISLMHCRNVEQREVTYTPVSRRRKASRQRPSIEYRTIHLPRPSHPGGRQSEATGTTRLHTARGHFKTYTAEAPLMGRHVGTYYWAAQARGRKKNGEIISIYKVGA